MADVKWSDNAVFIPQVSVIDTDYIMGLKTGNINAKYPVSLFATQGGTATFSKLNLPDTTPTWVFVGSGGSNSNNGQIIQALLGVIYADANATSGQTVMVSPGSYTGGQFLKRAFVDLFGSAKQNTTFTSSGLLGIDNTQWIAATAPYFKIADITLGGTASSYYSSVYVANSSQIFDSVKIVPNFVGGTMTTISFINDFEIATPYFKDVVNLTLDGGTVNGDVTFESNVDYTSVPTNNIVINNVKFNGAILLQTGISGLGNFDVTITNCSGITSITYDDSGSSLASTINIDADSCPPGGVIDNSGGFLTVNYLTNVAEGVSTESGLAVTNNGIREFAWSGTNSGLPLNQYTFTAGEGAHITNGSHNILLGNFATSNYSGCFVWNDGTATIGANHYPSAANQFVIWPTGGMGICVNNSTGPQAGFHYANNYGNDGKFLFSAKGVVADGNMSNSELNPYINTNQLIIKQKGSSGTITNYTFPSGSATIPADSTVVHNTGTENIGGTKTFTSPTILLEVQNPLISNLTPATITTTSTISAENLLGGVLYFNPSADITATLPIAADILTITGGISTNRGRQVRFVNTSAYNVTVAASASVVLTGLTTSGTLTLTPGAALSLDLIQISAGSFSLFGSSYGTLSYLEVNYLHSTTWSGIWASPQTGNLTITRLGNVVSVTLPPFTATSNAASTFSMDTVLPARFRPASDTWIVTNCQTNNSNYTNSLAHIATSGNITFYGTGNRDNFLSGVTVGPTGTNWHWNV